MEKEAKFIVPNRVIFERIQALDHVGPYERKDTAVKHVSDRYVDTPDRSFASHHFYMRLRKAGRGKGATLVTLKSTEAQSEGGIFSRDEYQIKVSDLDSATWPEGEVRSMVEQIGGGQPLTEVVTITQTRQVSILYEGERAVAEMSVDEVKIPTGGDPVNDYEVEVEMLPGGLDADLHILTRILAEDYSLIPQPLSKFERALQLASPNGSKLPPAEQVTDQESRQSSKSDGGRPTVKLESEPEAPSLDTGEAPAPAKAPKQPKAEKPRKAEKVEKVNKAGDTDDAGEDDKAEKKDEMGVRGTDSMGAAGRKIIGTYFRAMVDNEDGTREGEDPEALHDMRVATRRMRAALTVLEPYLDSRRVDRVRRGLRDVTRALGTVRDHDVLIEKAKDFRDKLPEEQQTDLDGLIEKWQDERDKGRVKLVDLLDSKQYERFKKQMNAFLEEEPEEPSTLETDIEPYQVRHAAGSAIWDRYEEVRAFETVMDNPTLLQLHALRIKGKYLRYTLECFREALAPGAGRVIDDVTKMQDQLGELHDADVAGGLIREYISSKGRKKKKKQEEREDEQAAPTPPGLLAYLEEQDAALRRLQADFAGTWARLDSPEWRIRLATLVALM